MRRPVWPRAIDRLAPSVIPTLARLVFAGVLLVYFWTSALTKVGPGLFGVLMPTDGAYVQILPLVVERAGYDIGMLSPLHTLIVVAGTLAEFVLPLLIVVGLTTRFAALGMIGFVAVQSATDVWGHGIGGGDLGRWFDAASGAPIADQRSLWTFVLIVLVTMGAGPLSLDAALRRTRGTAKV